MKELLQKIFDNPDSTIALVAVIISLISLFLAIISAYQNRKNNRLSVRPIAYVLPSDYEGRITVKIQNKGTGPLITKNIVFHGENNISKNSLVDFMPELYDNYYWSTFSKASTIIIRSSEELILLEFKGDPEDSLFIEQRDMIRKELSKIQIHLKYTSIFKERSPFELKYMLSWYGRRKN